MFEKFDGQFSPRPNQKEFLEELETCIDKYDIIIAQLTVGSGKSALARAIQKEFTTVGEDGTKRTIILNPNNLLVSQYSDTYSDLNGFKGANNYKCSDVLYDTCGAKKTAEGKCHKPCPMCPYNKAYTDFTQSREDTVTNIQAYAILDKLGKVPDFHINIIDEADSSIRFLESLTGIQISEDTLPCSNADVENVEAALLHLQKVKTQYKDAFLAEGNATKKDKLSRKIDHLDYVYDLLEANPDKYAFYIEESSATKKLSFCVKPVIIPASAVKRVLGNKAILLSATMFPSHLKRILGDVRVKVIKADSPFDAWRQQVLYRRFPGGIKYDTEVKKIVNKIVEDMEEFGVDGLNTNTLIHSSYSQRYDYVEYLRALGVNAITHDKENKVETLEHWKKTGGVLVGAGMAEGIDLKDNLVRLQFLPRIIKGTGEVLNKQRKLPRGWDLDMLRIWGNIIQTVGRGCRNPKDFCVFITYDTYFLQLFNKMKKMGEAPEYFYNTISLTGKIHKETPDNWRELFSKVSE